MRHLKLFEEFLHEEKLPDVPVNLKRIPLEVQQLMKVHFKDHPNAYAHEQEASGMDPLKTPLEYFRYELREPEHEDVRLKINKTGIMTVEDFQKWAKVNIEEEKERMTMEEKSLWDNIRAKRRRGEKPAKPGDEGYPDAKSWKAAQRKKED